MSELCSSPSMEEYYHHNPEMRRSYSTRSSLSRERPHRELQRHRPTTFHHRRPVKIPTVSVEVAAPASPPPQPRLSRPAERMDSLHIQQPGVSRSVSPRGPRRDSMMSVLNRIWKSDECTRKPTMLKMTALDVPTEEPLNRHLSVSETLVSPLPSARRSSLLSLTPKQRKLLKTSFAQLNASSSFLKIMEQVFRRLEAKCPDIRSIFLTTAFVNSLSRERSSPPLVKTEHDHCKCLVDMFDKIIASLDDVDSQLPLFRKYGEKHAQMRESGFTGAMIEHFGEIAVAVIGSHDSVKYNQDTVKAWRVLLAFVTDEMKVGFDRFAKISERRLSNCAPQQKQCPFSH